MGIVLVNRFGHIFAGQRIDSDVDAWQMPQGGIESGEIPLTAAWRELGEETGVSREMANVIAELPNWLTYDLPQELIPRLWNGKFRGQRQKWFLLQFDGEDSNIDIGTEQAEFSDWRWMSADEIIEKAISFKADTYRQVMGLLEGQILDISQNTSQLNLSD